MFSTVFFLLVASCLASDVEAGFESLSSSLRPESAVVTPWLVPESGAGGVSRSFCFVEDATLLGYAAELKQRSSEVTFARFADTKATVPEGVATLELKEPRPSSGNFGRDFDASVAAYESLKATEFDVLVFSSASGLAYMCEEAKRAGLAFEKTAIVVKAEVRPKPSESSLMTLVSEFIYHKSMEMADSVFVMGGTSLEEVRFVHPVSVWRCADRHMVISLLEAVTALPTPTSNVVERPLVSVIVTSFNRPLLLKETIASIQAQSYDRMEIIVVDDGSWAVGIKAALAELESQGVTVVRQKNQYLGAARNNGSRLAKGKFIFFLDDDNVALPHMVQTLVTAAERSGAPVVVNAHYNWVAAAGTPLPTGEALTSLPAWCPVGPAVEAGLKGNVFGNANFLISREAFFSMGGFTEDRTGAEDYEFHAKSAINGLDYVVVPEALMLYRQHDLATQMYASADREASRARVLRQYEGIVDEHKLHSFDERVVTSCTLVSAGPATPTTAGTSPECLSFSLRYVIVDDLVGSGYTAQTGAPTVSARATGQTSFTQLDAATYTCTAQSGSGGRVPWTCTFSGDFTTAFTEPVTPVNGVVELEFQGTFSGITNGPVTTVACGAVKASEPCRLPEGVCFHESTEINYEGSQHSMADLVGGKVESCHVPHVVTALGVSVKTSCSDKPLRLTRTHLVFTGRGLVHAAELRQGDSLFGDLEETQSCKVLSVTRESQAQRYFGLNCLKSEVLANQVKASTFGNLHTVPALWMSWAGRLLGIKRASSWGDAMAQMAFSLKLLSD